MSHLSKEKASSPMASTSLGKGEVPYRLFYAAYSGDLSLVKRLLSLLDAKDGLPEAIASIKDDDNVTLLHVAAAGGQTKICKYLVEEVKVDVGLPVW